MSKTIGEGSQGATIPFKPPEIKHNLKFYDGQILSICYVLFTFIANSSSVLVCLPTSKSLDFMPTAIR